MAIAPPIYLTWEEYLQRDQEDKYAEWVDGEIVYMSPVNMEDQRKEYFLLRLFGEFLDANPIGEVFFEGFLMRDRRRPAGRLPDILYISRENAYRLKRTHLDGPADLVIEIISPDSRKRDTIEKFQEYEALGVREYWWIDDENHEIRFFVLSAEGRFEEAFVDESGKYLSTSVPGFWIKTNWIWPIGRPSMREVRKEWGVE
jgi:Uma2 family endonuclease